MSEEKWFMETEKSKRLYEEALKYMPDGASSMTQSCPAWRPYPLYVERGQGSRIFDVDGNCYIDHWLAAGPLILGHANEKIVESVQEQLQKGTTFSAGTQLMVDVAKKVTDLVPCAEKVRFCSTGTDAVLYTIRVARAFTGKEKVLKFEGQYHGWEDTVFVSYNPPASSVGMKTVPHRVPASAGIPRNILDNVIVASWNDTESIEKTVKQHKHELAAILTAPLPASMGVVPPREGYLKTLRELTEENDILLIFDEVITGFRISLGGAQEYYGVTPDLVALAKALGGGFPIAAFAGKEEVMKTIGADKVVHAGTLNANALCLAASKATLEELESGGLSHIHEVGNMLVDGIKRLIRDFHIDAVVQGTGSLFSISFTNSERIEDYRDFLKVDRAKYDRFSRELLKRNVWIWPPAAGHWFVSSAHTRNDVNEVLRAVEEALRLV